MITALAHVCFTVRDLVASEKFYIALGLKVAFEFRHETGDRYGVYFHVGGRNFIEVFEGEVQPPPQHPSFRHICLEVDDIRASVESFRRNGVEVGEIKMGKDHSHQAWLKDPDGNAIELHQYTPESWQTPSLK
jgi:catechol 2,3-dioxygenase-like lactoylglutathione lyase family enzyme